MTTRRLWVPVLTALLAMALVGGGVAAADVEPRAVRTITIPAGDFSVIDDSYTFHNNGFNLWSDSGSAAFAAPLFFEPGVVTIQKMVLFAYDNGGSSVCIYLLRTTPGNGSEQEMGEVCSSGASTTDPQSFTSTYFAPAQVNSAWYGPYLWLYQPGSNADGYKFNGVRITYSY